MLRTFFGEERGGRNQNSTYVYPLEFNPVFDGNTAITRSSWVGKILSECFDSESTPNCNQVLVIKKTLQLGLEKGAAISESL